MQNKYKFRAEVLRTFLMIFIPHMLILLITSQTTSNFKESLPFQICWFTIYTTISIGVLIYSHIKNKRNLPLKNKKE